MSTQQPQSSESLPSAQGRPAHALSQANPVPATWVGKIPVGSASPEGDQASGGWIAVTLGLGKSTGSEPTPSSAPGVSPWSTPAEGHPLTAARMQAGNADEGDLAYTAPTSQNTGCDSYSRSPSLFRLHSGLQAPGPRQDTYPALTQARLGPAENQSGSPALPPAQEHLGVGGSRGQAS